MVSVTIGKKLSSNGLLYSVSSMGHLRVLHVSLRLKCSVSRLKPFRKPLQSGGGITLNDVADVRMRGVDMTQSEIDFLTKDYGHPDEWQLIYRLRAMPIAQAFSRLKLLLTFSLAVGTSMSMVGHLVDLVDVELCRFLFAASLFSLCTLCVFSFYSTKVIGVISQNKSTGLLRLGLLNFWGMRRNVVVHPEQLLPAADLSDSDKKRTVRVGLTGDILNLKYPKIRSLYISSLTGQIGDCTLFEKYVGRMRRKL
ncbi:transmembrane protein 186 [Echinococcus multilocularis]|uniref:Transmembrane protein 186 n=1 Tax=Echinococcus multilocularis TaxID=6211 RepID=A0A087VX57_ECHMU|nr:transmembrane protein 186 [Echinococcus multilocularis]